MADTANTELERQGGIVPFTLGQLLTSADMRRAQQIGLQTLHHWLMLFAYDHHNDAPLQGFPEESDHCLATMVADLTGSVAPGIGYLFDSTKLDPAGDAWDHEAYRPIVVDVAETFVLGAHDATNPRWDIISLAPAWEEDESDTRRIKNPTTLVESSQSVPLRKRYYFTLTVTPGTPAASPVEPSVPAGHIKIARAEVPAGSGAAVLRDTRPLWQLGSLFKGHPAKEYAKNYIPNPSGAATALEIGASSPTSMVLTVQPGRAVIRGISRWYARQLVTVTTAHATLPRIDLVCAREDGTVTVTAGTAAADPDPPAAPANSIPLCEVAVAAADTTIAAGDLTDLRSSRVDGADALPGYRRPYGDDQFDDYAINHSKLSVPEVFVFLDTPTTLTHTLCEIPIELFLPDQVTEYEGPFGEQACAFEVFVEYYLASTTLAGWTAAPADFTALAAAGGYHNPDMLYNQTGLDAFNTAWYAVWHRPTTGSAADVNEDGLPGTSGRHVFWMAERTGELVIERRPDVVGSQSVMVTVRPIGRPGGARRRIVEFPA